ncbi:HAMP domain-containing protein [Candidatus Gracilibacteria bacterium]|nr:HAMP domain-containing protein [Candidatus Gracilibacteria bacterium]
MRFSIRAKLLAALGVDLLLMLALGTFAVFQMGRMNEKAIFVQERTIPSLNANSQIQLLINDYRVKQIEYLVIARNEFDRARTEGLMSDIEASMASLLSRYQPLVDSDEERARLENVSTAWAALVDANWNQFIPAARLTDSSNSGNIQPTFSRMNPLYNRLNLAAAQLAQESERQADAAFAVVENAYQTSRYVITADTVLALIISAGIGFILSGRIANRLGRLTFATVEVANGNLGRSVTDDTHDEVGTLAGNFNRMVDSLREQRSTLQQRNLELEDSLRRQQQLMADLVRQRQAEEEALRAQAAAEAASQAKSMFLATMSHELRTPMNAVLGYAQLLRLNAAARGNDEVIPQLDRILAAGRHLTTIINNVLDFSKIEQGKIDLDIVEFSISTLIDEVDGIIVPLVARNQNRLTILCPPDIGSMQADQTKVRQILFNLLSNAAKFTREGRITLRVWTSADSEYILFEVIDTGIGIPAEKLDRLFTPFTQVDSSVTRRFEGTGLGLALSRQLCRVMGGDISVTSAVGAGSTFTVVLPRHVAALTAQTMHAPLTLYLPPLAELTTSSTNGLQLEAGRLGKPSLSLMITSTIAISSPRCGRSTATALSAPIMGGWR